ncbi:MAG: hypothetical protein V3T83_19370 [Acidobacteriota bacterium]
MRKTVVSLFILASAGLAAVFAWVAQQPEVPEKYKFALALVKNSDTWPEYTPGTIRAPSGRGAVAPDCHRSREVQAHPGRF